jgi:hypothetical protein
VFSIPLIRREPAESSLPENRENASNQRQLAPSVLHDTCQTDPDLAVVIDAWPTLPADVRTKILNLARGGR